MMTRFAESTLEGAVMRAAIATYVAEPEKRRWNWRRFWTAFWEGFREGWNEILEALKL
jgi:hypothetical protein